MGWFSRLFGRKPKQEQVLVPIPMVQRARYNGSGASSSRLSSISGAGNTYYTSTYSVPQTVVVERDNSIFGLGPVGDAVILNKMLNSHGTAEPAHDAPHVPVADPSPAPDAHVDSSPSYDPSPSYSDSGSSYSDSSSSYSDSGSSGGGSG